MANKTYILKKKQPKALWTKIKSPGFRHQQERAHPELAAAGGVKARSDSEQRRMESYRPLAEMFKRQNPVCAACHIINPNPLLSSLQNASTEDVHHKRGRDGLLLFNSKYWIPVCRECHNWIRDNTAKARELGLDESHKL